MGDIEAKSSEPVLEKRRWFIALSTAGLTLTSDLVWASFSPLNILAQEYYKKSPNVIDMVSVTYLISGIVFLFLASTVIEKWGMLPTMRTVSVINLVGCIVRFCSIWLDPETWGFYFIFVGAALGIFLDLTI